MKRDPQQMARVPLFLVPIVRHHQSCGIVCVVVFCTPCYGRQPLPVRFWLRFVRVFFLFVVCTPCYRRRLLWCFFFVVCTPCYRAPALRAALFDCCCVCYEASGRIFTFSRSAPPKSDRGGGSKIGLLVYIVLGWLALSRTSRRCHLFSADVCVVHVSFVVRLSLFRCAMESFARSPIYFFEGIGRKHEATFSIRELVLLIPIFKEYSSKM